MKVEFIEWLKNEIQLAKDGQDFYFQGLADAYELALEKYKEICNDT